MKCQWAGFVLVSSGTRRELDQFANIPAGALVQFPRSLSPLPVIPRESSVRKSWLESG